MKSAVVTLETFSIVLILYGVIYYLYVIIMSKKNDIIVSNKNISSPRFCIVIPARDESKVIENLLISIKNQNYKMSFDDVYIIVEDIEDKTVEISKKYSANIIVRRKLELKRKGYALDEGIKEIIKRKNYDAYFIFDADNILDGSYLSKMKETYDMGYDIGIGYRNCKNGDDNIISACSALTFSMINTISNRRKMKNNNTLTISGTGFYISGDLINKWKGYPFHSLTEDYELTLYATLNGISTMYNEKAIFYDEQPTKYKTTKNQRIRWIRGYFDSRKDYIYKLKLQKKKDKSNYGSIITEIVGVKPFIIMIIGLILFLISNCISDIINNSNFIFNFLIVLFVSYIILLLITLSMIIKEKDKLCLSTTSKVRVILFNPLYLITYVPCAIRAIITKDISWDKIEHDRN